MPAPPPMPPPPPRLFVAFPVHGVLWPQSMQTAMAAFCRGGVFAMEGCAWLDAVRSELVGQFLETREELLLFIDADNWFDMSVVELLVAAKADVITATYRQRLPPHQYVAIPAGRTHPRHAPMRHLQPGGERVIEIERDGLGCCLIRRHVVETLYAKHVDLNYISKEGKTRCNLFEYGIFEDEHGVRRAGQEDRAFFERVRAAGFKCECLMDAVVMHAGIPGRFAEILNE